ncbi:hypothetical protein ACQEVZ_20215 [Dactylosporangium sp. CA-152071]|uniref:hypothetical protein n=1 Tax=Dactylosporangium sp. CA-152071 TaxID=3239933 RepID=UPI003D8BB95E
MTSGKPGSAYQAWPTTESRLDAWARLARTNLPVDDIARRIGIDRRALDRLVARARKRGDPRAIYHRDAHLPGTGTAHLRDKRARAAHLRRTRGTA